MTTANTGDDLTRTLEAALTAWRRSPTDEAATLVETLGARAAIPAALRKREVTQPTWLRFAKAPTASLVTPLLARWTVRVFPPAGVRDFSQVLARLEALEGWDRDPRLAAALRTFLSQESARARGGLLSDEFLVPALRLLGRQKDPRTTVWRHDFVQKNPARIEFLRRTLVRAAKRVPIVAAVASTTHAARTHPSTSGAANKPHIDHLFERVHASPADLSARAVLADAWLEAGMARGQLLELALREFEGKLTRPEVDKLRALERKFARELLGDLKPIASIPAFWGGFLDTFVLHQRAKAAPAMWKAALHAPQLRTVRAIDRGHADLQTWLQFLEASPHLQRAHADSLQAFKALVTAPVARRVPVLHVSFRAPTDGARLLAHFSALESLRTSSLDLEDTKAWAQLSRAPRFEATLPLVIFDDDHESRMQGIVVPVVDLLENAGLREVCVNNWQVNRTSDGLRLRFNAGPVRGSWEAWTLVAFSRSPHLRFGEVEVTLTPRLLDETPALKKALAALKGPFARAVRARSGEPTSRR